ncbi:UDP-N-acetylglucosamine 1-carboxyvinyltransferase [Fastidiosibacter lacustris]|uniref:UDP-N-acetylglucosamine 1-carboxyvinyltransferase n=1 Tax=Fastidiosibacter lacustris TaxID=2056695 RepID=UPI000E345E64|nr:UDP-N-acetylglucosamine 1-carboxyvinyltransferase [Fastidiosibacter lacustris]
MQLKVSKRHNLNNDVTIQLNGAKNALLHLLFASLLPNAKTVFNNVPTSLNDYLAVCDILKVIGAKVYEQSNTSVEITPPEKLSEIKVSTDYTRRTRTSLMLLGALAKKVSKLIIGYPGGCSFSDQRPFDIHLQGFEALGAKVYHDEYHIAIEYDTDKNTEYKLRYPSVGASINLMLYAAIGSAEVILHNIALEPEVIEVASFINQCGGWVRIDHNTRSMHIKGVVELIGVNFRIMYDRIQTMTYAALAYLHEVDVCIEGIDTKEYIDKPLRILNEMGAHWRFDPAKQQIYFCGKISKLKPIKVTAMPYPEFPTDMQPIFSVMCIKANGPSEITDTVYPERVKYVQELERLGFPISCYNNTIQINPNKSYRLHATTMKSYDLRAGMAVIMAASLLDQVCTITSAQQVFRGYQNLLENMTNFMHISIDDN